MAIDDDAADTPGSVTEKDHVRASLRAAASCSALIVVALAGLVAFLAVRTHQTHQTDEQRDRFVETGRQTALNLTTIGWQHADEDVARILTSATGSFYDDFSQRSKPFVDVVKQTQSTSVGTVTAAGLQSLSGKDAQVLVTVSVTTTDATTPQGDPRSWRMRMTIESAGDQDKVSNVEFVQ